MSTIVTRAGKGAPLTHSEVDANFTNLNTDKYQAGDNPSFGNITVTGTVDGRDVSADGTKLDGIEAGATADQTAAEILTAIKTVDGSGSGLDADLLDGQHASAFATAAQGALADTAIQPADLATVATSGSYNDLINTPSPFDPNTLATVATTGSYTDLTNIPANIVTDAAYVHTDNNYTTTEKNKLAGIEAGATADQTAAEILTAIKTVDGAGSGLDADTLDGQHASAFLTGNQTITLTGDVSGSGTTSISVAVADDSHNHSNYLNRSASIEGNLDSKYDADMFGWSTSTVGRPENYGQGISIVSSGTTHNNSSNWITQLGFGTAGNTAYFRTKVNSGSWGPWQTIWHSGRDGSGSGLDADLLDGQHGSYYYSPANPPAASAPTTAQVLAAVAQTSAGAVGSYALLRHVGLSGLNVAYDWGTTFAGSALRTANSDNSGYVGATPAGTWRLMGYIRAIWGNDSDGTRVQYATSVFLRIA